MTPTIGDDNLGATQCVMRYSIDHNILVVCVCQVLVIIHNGCDGTIAIDIRKCVVLVPACNQAVMPGVGLVGCLVVLVVEVVISVATHLEEHFKRFIECMIDTLPNQDDHNILELCMWGMRT